MKSNPFKLGDRVVVLSNDNLSDVACTNNVGTITDWIQLYNLGTTDTMGYVFKVQRDCKPTGSPETYYTLRHLTAVEELAIGLPS